MRWYLNRTGTGEGPFDEPTLVGMITSGEVLPNHQICPEGQQAWLALNTHPAFAQALAGPPAQAPAAPAAPVASPQFQPAPSPFQAPPGAGPATDVDVVAPGPGGQVNTGPMMDMASGVNSAAQPAAPFGQDLNAAANVVGGEVNAAANAFGNALAAPGAAPIVAAPSSAAPGEGFFAKAQAEGATPSADALAGAGQAHLFGALGALLTCGCLGGIAGAFVGSILYKEEPKSSFALYHINQAVLYQGGLFIANIAVSIIMQVVAFAVGFLGIGILSLVFSGISGLIFLAFWGAAVLLPFLQRGKALKGEWSQYPVIGGKVMGLKSPVLK